MAKNSSTLLMDRAGQVSKSAVSLPPFVSQAEIVYVLHLRAQLTLLQDKLLTAQEEIRHKLADGAEVEYGYYACAHVNMQVKIWENDSQKVL